MTACMFVRKRGGLAFDRPCIITVFHKPCWGVSPQRVHARSFIMTADADWFDCCFCSFHSDL